MDFLQILVLYFLPLLTSVNTFTIDNHKLIYSQCSNKTSTNPSHSALLPNLFNQFISKSSKSNFFETIVGDDHQNFAISGAFQCRNDLRGEQCKTCVQKLPSLMNNLCGENMPARIQLSGCSAHYYQENLAKIEMDTNPNDQIILHRACSKRRIRRSGFEEMKYAAFASLENCVVSGEGFCETKYDESIRVLTQCGGSLRNCDCGECVSNAVAIAGDDECRFSVSGEIYLDSCFISYDYYGSRFGTFMDEGNKTGKLVAIAVGGLVVLSIGVGFLYFISSCGKKDDW